MRELIRQIEDETATPSLTTVERHHHTLTGGTKEGGGDTGVRDLESLREAEPLQRCLMRAGITEKTAAVENAACARIGKKHSGFSFPPALNLTSVRSMLQPS